MLASHCFAVHWCCLQWTLKQDRLNLKSCTRAAQRLVKVMCLSLLNNAFEKNIRYLNVVEVLATCSQVLIVWQESHLKEKK